MSETLHGITLVTLTVSTLAPCTDFCYLGCNVGDSKRAFQRRRQVAWGAARKLTTVWNLEASDAAKMQLFQSTVQTVLLYSCEALTLTDTLASRLDASHCSLVRYCLGVRFPERLSSTDLYVRAQVAPATTTLKRCRLHIVGHALRRPEVPLAVLLHPKNQPSEPFRRGGALRRTYYSQITDDLNSMGLTR